MSQHPLLRGVSALILAFLIWSCGVATSAVILGPEPVGSKRDVITEKDGFVTFTAQWCVPCKRQHRENDVLRKRGYRITYVDIDKDPDLFDEIANQPTVPYTVVVRNKEITHHFVGVTSWQALEQAFKQKGK